MAQSKALPAPIQIVQNGNFVNKRNWGVLRASWSVSNNVASITAAAISQYAYGLQSYDYDLGMITGHKYLLSLFCTPTNDTMRIYAHNKYLPNQTLTPDQSNRIQLMFTDSGTSGATITFYFGWGATYEIGDYFELSKVNIIDLTATFGEGNEPSTVEEFRAIYPNDFYEYNP